MGKDVVYRECANGRMEFWTYSDGQRVYVARHWVEKELNRNTIRLVTVK